MRILKAFKPLDLRVMTIREIGQIMGARIVILSMFPIAMLFVAIFCKVFGI